MRVLKERNFAFVWTSGLVSDTGDWLLMIALPLFAFAVTGSALGASTVFLAELLPTLLFGSILGVLVDRWDHRRTMIVVNLAQGIALLPLLWASADRLWIVFAVAGVEAFLAALFNPAKQALLPRLVPSAQLGSGNALIAVSDNIARLVGSPLGGLAFATVGLHGVVVADAASYVVSAALVACSRVQKIVPSAASLSTDATTGVFRQWIAGFGTIRRTRPLPTLWTLASLGGFAQGLFLVLFMVYVVDTLHAGGTEVGVLRGVQAIGGILGGLVVGVLVRRFSFRALIGWGFIVFSALCAVTWNLYPFTTAVGFYVALFIAMGIPGVATTTGEITLVQRATPAPMLGRVIATLQTSAGAAQGLGLLAAGFLSSTIGVVSLLNMQALVYLACGIIGLVALRTYSTTTTECVPSAGSVTVTNPSDWV